MKLATKIKRLRELADLLDRVPRRKFDMGTWANRLPSDLDPAKEDECGTTACALGWATALPFARRLGAKLVLSSAYPFMGNVRTRRSYYASDVARELFGVSGAELAALFYSRPNTPTGKAAQIRALCDGLEAR